MEFHPNSGRATKTVPMTEYGQQEAESSRTPQNEPWRPFRSRADFEFAEIALDTAMNQKQVDALIKLFYRCIDNKGSFTLGSHQDMKLMWDSASCHLTGVCAQLHIVQGIYSNL